MFVLEGPDGGGKSTLAKNLKRIFDWPIQPGEGPTHSQEEADERFNRHARLGNRVIFDRHMVISESIYGPIYGRPPFIRPAHFAQFFAARPLIILCLPPRYDLSAQDNPNTDTPEYLEKLHSVHGKVIEAYQRFFEGFPPVSIVTYDWSNQRALSQRIRSHYALHRDF